MTALTQPIIYSVGVVGSAKSAAKFAAVAAAVAVAGRALNNVRKDAEAFAMQWRALDPEMRKVAMALDAAGKGLVDTGQALKSTQQLMQAQIGPTKELTSAIGKLATSEGIKLGETYDQINARVQKLTDSIAKGQSRALKEYGIDLDNTEDLLLAQAEAIEKVTERAKGLTVELTNVDQQMEAMINNKDTFLGLWYEWATRSNSVGGSMAYVNEIMEDSNKIIVETDGAILDVINSFEGYQTILNVTMFDMLGFNNAAHQQRVALHSLTEQWKSYNSASKNVPTPAPAGAPSDSVMGSAPKLSPVDPALFTKKKKTGGGGGKKGPSFDMEFTESEVAQGELDWLLGTEEAYIDEAGRIWEDAAAAVDAKATASAYIDEAGRIWEDAAAAVDAKMNELRGTMDVSSGEVEDYESVLDFEREQERIAEIYQVSQMETMLGIDQAYTDASYDMWQSSIRGKAKLLEGFFATGAQLMNAYSAESESANKTMFNYAKGMAIAQAVMKTYESAVSSYASLSGIPYVGPVLGFIAAANAVAFGVAQVRQIAATKFDAKGGGGGSKSISGGGGGGGGASAGAGAGAWQGGGGGDSGGDTYYIVQGGLWASDDAAEAMRSKFIENESTGHWPHGLRESG